MNTLKLRKWLLIVSLSCFALSAVSRYAHADILFDQQAGATQVAAVGTQDKALTGVAAGSLLVWVSTNRDPGDFVTGIVDDVDSTAWTCLTSNSDASTAANLCYFVSSGGDVTATATFNRTLEGPSIANLIEFSASADVELDDQASNDNASGTSHSHGSLDISSADGVIVGTCSLSGGDSSTYSAATNYQKLSDGGGFRILSQYREAASTLTGETATWTSGSDSITTACLIASFVQAGGSSPLLKIIQQH